MNPGIYGLPSGFRQDSYRTNFLSSQLLTTVDTFAGVQAGAVVSSPSMVAGTPQAVLNLVGPGYINFFVVRYITSTAARAITVEVLVDNQSVYKRAIGPQAAVNVGISVTNILQAQGAIFFQSACQILLTSDITTSDYSVETIYQLLASAK